MTMQKTLIALSILLAGCSSHQKAQNNLEVEVGAEAAAVGHVPLTEALVRDHVLAADAKGLLSRQHLSKDHRRLANDTLVRFYWEQGEDHALLDHLERHYHPAIAKPWECRVYERRGHEDEAEDCWISARKEYGEDARRVTRTKVLVDVFAGEDVQYGLQKRRLGDDVEMTAD